jgi:hypothetical protein
VLRNRWHWLCMLVPVFVGFCASAMATDGWNMWTKARHDRAGLGPGHAYLVIAVSAFGVIACALRCTRVRTVIDAHGIVVHRLCWRSSRPWASIVRIDVTTRHSRSGPDYRYLRVKTRRGERTRLPASLGDNRHATEVLRAVERFRPASVECEVSPDDLATSVPVI